MKKLIVFLTLLIAAQHLLAQTTNVATHNKVLINTDPSQGVKSFVKWGEFPSADKEIRRIVLNLTLAYPEERAIAHWE